MSSENLSTYLNDHLAGSQAAVSLLSHLADLYKSEPTGKIFLALQSEIVKDQEVLKELLSKCNFPEGKLRQAAGWMAEKISRIKLESSGLNPCELGLVEALELLMLGIRGKEALWKVLQNLESRTILWPDVDFLELQNRAAFQATQAEALRCEAARKAFRPSPLIR